MASPDTDRLQTIKEDLNGILEERITDLMSHVKAAQEVTRQLAATELDIRHQTALQNQYEAELSGLVTESRDLKKGNSELEEKLEKMRANVARMKKLREDLMTNLSGLTKDLQSATPNAD